MNSINYLISTVFNIYIMIVILRVWLQAARADFYNPFSQFVVKATNPIIGPLRRIIPSIGSIDVATLLFAYVLCLSERILLILINNGLFIFNPLLLVFSALALLKAAGSLLFWVLILRALMSWVSQGRSPIELVFQQLTEPLLAPIRRMLPATGGIDFSMIVLFIGLQFANLLIADILLRFGLQW